MSNGMDKQLEKLQRTIADEHARFVTAARQAVTAFLSGYGLGLFDLIEQPKTKPAKVVKTAAKVVKAPKVKVTPKKGAKAVAGNGKSKSNGRFPPKYIDPATGATWTGMGHAPAWIRDSTNRDAFLINKA